MYSIISGFKDCISANSLPWPIASDCGMLTCWFKKSWNDADNNWLAVLVVAIFSAASVDIFIATDSLLEGPATAIASVVCTCAKKIDIFLFYTFKRINKNFVRLKNIHRLFQLNLIAVRSSIKNRTISIRINQILKCMHMWIYIRYRFDRRFGIWSCEDWRFVWQTIESRRNYLTVIYSWGW